MCGHNGHTGPINISKEYAMRILVVALLSGLYSIVANAQAFRVDKPVICDESKKIISALNEHWNERLIWTAGDAKDQSRYGLFVNDKTGSWTMLQLTPEVACIIGTGDKSQLVLGTKI